MDTIQQLQLINAAINRLEILKSILQANTLSNDIKAYALQEILTINDTDTIQLNIGMLKDYIKK